MNKIYKLLKYSSFSFSDLVILSSCLICLSWVGYKLPVSLMALYSSSDPKNFSDTVALILYLYIFQYLLRAFYQYHLSFISKQALINIRSDLFESWLNDRSSWKGNVQIDKFSAGEIQTRILSDPNAIKESVDNATITVFFDFVLVLSCLISFLIINIKIGIIIFITELFIVFFLLYLSKKIAPTFYAVRRVHAILSKNVTDILKGLHQIFKLKQNDYVAKRMEPVQKEYAKIQMKGSIFDATYFSITDALFPLFLSLFIVILPRNSVKFFALLAVLVDLTQRSLMPMKELANKISSLQRVFASLDRISEFRDALYPVNRIATSQLEYFKNIVSVSFDIHEFNYESEHLIRDENSNRNFQLHPLNFKLKKHSSLGIAGRTGAGKTTLAKILSLQLFSPNTKVILELEDGTSRMISFLKEDDLKFYANLISIVSQETHIFSTSLLYNITLEDKLSDEFLLFWNEIQKDLSYVRNWGIFYNDKIIPYKLSFGQRQLISALRAIFLKRPIIMFDEISAGMDKNLEVSLYSLLNRLTQNCILIVVAHRLETIMRCNNILLIDHGKCVDFGTHNELWEKSRLYKEYLLESNEI